MGEWGRIAQSEEKSGFSESSTGSRHGKTLEEAAPLTRNETRCACPDEAGESTLIKKGVTANRITRVSSRISGRRVIYSNSISAKYIMCVKVQNTNLFTIKDA